MRPSARPRAARRLAVGLCLGLGLAGCGYTTRVVGPDGDDVTVFVPPVQAPGVDVDAAGLVDARLRRAVARAAGLRLGGAAGAQATLRVEVLEVRTGLAAFAEPALRAAQYEAVVRLRGLWQWPDGKTWRSPAVSGTTPFLSTGGAIERLDGAGRRALAGAAEQASERLVAALVLQLRRPDATSPAAPGTSTTTSTRSAAR